MMQGCSRKCSRERGKLQNPQFRFKPPPERNPVYTPASCIQPEALYRATKTDVISSCKSLTRRSVAHLTLQPQDSSRRISSYASSLVDCLK